MSNPQIVYNGVTLAFPEELSFYDRRDPQAGVRNTSDGGVTETIRHGVWDEILITVEDFADSAFFRNLHAWWAWAQRGQQYAFARDASRTYDSTIDAATTTGQKTVMVTATAGLTAGDSVLLTSADLTKREVVVVDTISAGVSFESTTNLIYSYAAADVARHLDYYPKMVSLDDSKPFRENQGVTYSLSHRAQEDRG